MKHTIVVDSREPVKSSVVGIDNECRPSPADHRPLKLLRFSAVRERTGLSRSTIWRLERRGAFPKHIKISTNVVAWLEEDVLAWIRSKAEQLSI